jgi:hypothetical protein
MSPSPFNTPLRDVMCGKANVVGSTWKRDNINITSQSALESTRHNVMFPRYRDTESH